LDEVERLIRAMDAEYLDRLNEKQRADAEEAEAKRK
jgi:hypothetical protein